MKRLSEKKTHRALRRAGVVQLAAEALYVQWHTRIQPIGTPARESFADLVEDSELAICLRLVRSKAGADFLKITVTPPSWMGTARVGHTFTAQESQQIGAQVASAARTDMRMRV